MQHDLTGIKIGIYFRRTNYTGIQMVLLMLRWSFHIEITKYMVWTWWSTEPSFVRFRWSCVFSAGPYFCTLLALKHVKSILYLVESQVFMVPKVCRIFKIAAYSTVCHCVWYVMHCHSGTGIQLNPYYMGSDVLCIIIFH